MANSFLKKDQIISKKLSFQESTFVVVIVPGVVFEKGNAAPTPGLISRLTRVLAGTGVTLKATSICWFCAMELRLGPAPPSLAENSVRDELLPSVRMTGAVEGVEKTTFNFVKSIVGAPGARPMENLISVIFASSAEMP